MKAKHLLLTALFLLAGCSLIWTPTFTVKKFMTAAQKGDVDTMTQLFSSKAVQKLGANTIRSNNQSFADSQERARAAGGTYRMENIQETSIPEGRRVSFLYKNEKGTDSIKLVFDLSKEGSAWKIDNIGGPELEAAGPIDLDKSDLELQTLMSPTPLASSEPSGVTTIVPAPPPPSEKSQTETKPVVSGKTISGGVLNGKAISLPKPAYPPIAKAAKASGTVVVQVTVDENGNVISANAVSGHPLLQATCAAAARAAKFPPTKLSGQPVKVNGVINYNFTAE